MFLELDRVTGELEKMQPRAIVLTGCEEAFCAGFDVNPDNPWVAELIHSVEKADRQAADVLVGRVRKIVDRFVSLPVPVVAAINGLAYGGGAELAVRCDLRVMDPAAEICFSEARLGLMPDWGGGAALAHLIGASRAADVILTARPIAAGEAISIGLVNRVSRPGESREDAVKMAEMISKNGPRAVSCALRLIRESRNQSLNQSLDMEMDTAVALIASGECFHGVAAFLEKRTPEFPDVEYSDLET
jgi:enoyl-CoA hydratase